MARHRFSDGPSVRWMSAQETEIVGIRRDAPELQSLRFRRSEG